MKRRIGKRGLRQGALVAVNAFNDCIDLIVKNAGGKTPALGGPSFGGNRILYTMR